MTRATSQQTISNNLPGEELLKQLAHNQKMAELGQISAGLVHELNAPLSVIISASQLIMLEDDLAEPVREMVARIGSEAQRLSQLTRGLLSFSTYDEGEGETDVTLTVEFILDFISYEASRRSVLLARTLESGLPMVRVSSNLLRQVLLNVVMNALQAMEENGGSLTVESRLAERDEIQITIADTGQGMTAEVLERAFEPCFTTKKPGTGTGLGLFVTRSLLEQAGGGISASSTPGRGSCFTITLPAA